MVFTIGDPTLPAPDPRLQTQAQERTAPLGLPDPRGRPRPGQLIPGADLGDDISRQPLLAGLPLVGWGISFAMNAWDVYFADDFSEEPTPREIEWLPRHS